MDYTLKVDRMQFDAMSHEKWLAFDAVLGERIPESPRITPSPSAPANAPSAPANAPSGEPDPNEPRYIIEHAVMPAEPINAFGIPQATMRCLEVRVPWARA